MKEVWDAISEVLDAIIIRLKQTDLDVEKMEFRIRALENELQTLRNSKNESVGNV